MKKRRNRRRLLLLTIIPVVLGAALVSTMLMGSFSCSKGGYSGRVESLTVGAPALEANALIYIAADKGYFERNGLKVTIKEYDSGGAAVRVRAL